MLDDQTRIVLQATARRLTRSFLQYTDESVPWTTPEEEPGVERAHSLHGCSRHRLLHAALPPPAARYA